MKKTNGKNKRMA